MNFKEYPKDINNVKKQRMFSINAADLDRADPNSMLRFLDRATCNFTAVRVVKDCLEQNGFSELKEESDWKLTRGGRYFVIKNDTAVFAFIVGEEKVEESGFRIISAHTDSPCFKIKPNCEIYGDGGVVSLNVEKYGGGIMYTWFDRPLSIAGRVMLRTDDPMSPGAKIIDLDTHVATIPHLAIHFNRAVNDGNKLSVQKDMKPVIGYFTDSEIDEFKKNGGVIKSLLVKYINDSSKGDKVNPDDILDYELCLYPYESAGLCGMRNEYLQSARIDDLSMAFCGIAALLADAARPSASTRMVALFDNEETGSGTKQGAASPVLRHIFERVCLVMSDEPQAVYRALARSFMISADDAHGWHPNYNDKYDPTNHPVLGGGPVVKINANCKYMTDAQGAAVFHALCVNAGVNMQYFVNHADVAGGSTLGNISSSQFDVKGVDVGCAIWAMHSARETAAVSDHFDMIKVMREFLK